MGESQVCCPFRPMLSQNILPIVPLMRSTEYITSTSIIQPIRPYFFLLRLSRSRLLHRVSWVNIIGANCPFSLRSSICLSKLYIFQSRKQRRTKSATASSTSRYSNIVPDDVVERFASYADTSLAVLDENDRRTLKPVICHRH